MLEKRSLSTSSINLSFDEPEPEEKRVESGEELKIDSEKYQKIGILTDLNNITESEAQIKYIDKVKYYNDYKLIKTLGAGSICKVKLVEKDNVKYALKIVNKNILSKKKKFEQDENGKMVITTPMEGILKEIAILKSQS